VYQIFQSTYGYKRIRKQDRVNAEAILVRPVCRNPGPAEVRGNPDPGRKTDLGTPQLWI